jgi:O-antigen biosynthesis protein
MKIWAEQTIDLLGVSLRTGSVDRPAPSAERLRVDGKQFAVGQAWFPFRGVTYGTFRPRVDGARYPDPFRVREDFAAIANAGFTVVRTYTVPPDDVVAAAAELGLRLLVGAFYPDWRYLVGSSRRQRRRVVAEAAGVVRDAAERFAGDATVAAFVIGNEIPSDVIRWHGESHVAGAIHQLADVIHDVDDGHLVTYANFPTTEFLAPLGLDFLTFNVFLEQAADLRRYLTRLHHLAGDRPLVLGEIGLHAGDDGGGEDRQASFVDEQLSTAIERGVAGTCLFSWTDEWWVGDDAVEGWKFGLTRTDRSPRRALDVARSWNGRTVRDLDVQWPTMSIVICAYNAASTLDECVSHACALDYPALEVIVVDDGSTDETADIVRRHPSARLLQIPHAGLSVARNEGFRAAGGEIVAYLDADAYPSADWPYYLVLGLDDPDLVGVGGPNVAPRSDPMSAHAVAAAPGGPVHVLFSDDRAEHIPGCNMAFWKEALVEIGGFDPIFQSAGDDVDLCWRLLDDGGEIGFHPAALVWHHRRPTVRAYLRQQRGYGRSEALVEARHPQRFTSTGSARWSGRIYNPVRATVGRARIYHGIYGAASYQSVYRSGGYFLDLLHQIGVPAAFIVLMTLPAAALSLIAGIPAAAALAFLLTLFVTDAVGATPPRHCAPRATRFRLTVALMQVLQPLVRHWSRLRTRAAMPKKSRSSALLGPPTSSMPRGVLIYGGDRPREDLAAELVSAIGRSGVRIAPPSEWEPHDARLLGSTLVEGYLLTSSHPAGSVQVRVHRRARRLRVVTAAIVLLGAAAVGVIPGVVVGVVVAVEVARGLWRLGPGLNRHLNKPIL